MLESVQIFVGELFPLKLRELLLASNKNRPLPHFLSSPGLGLSLLISPPFSPSLLSASLLLFQFVITLKKKLIILPCITKCRDLALHKNAHLIFGMIYKRNKDEV